MSFNPPRIILKNGAVGALDFNSDEEVETDYSSVLNPSTGEIITSTQQVTSRVEPLILPAYLLDSSSRTTSTLGAQHTVDEGQDLGRKTESEDKIAVERKQVRHP
jgi:hypothetical protein